MYSKCTTRMKREYGPRVLQVEKATMTAAVMSRSGEQEAYKAESVKSL